MNTPDPDPAAWWVYVAVVGALLAWGVLGMLP